MYTLINITANDPEPMVDLNRFGGQFLEMTIGDAVLVLPGVGLKAALGARQLASRLVQAADRLDRAMAAPRSHL